ncbi:MAG: OmpA family protein [Bacteroidota bacterium]
MTRSPSVSTLLLCAFPVCLLAGCSGSRSSRDAETSTWQAQAGGFGMDRDADGLPDDEETGRYRTDPSNPDTDGDGLRDGQEVRRHKTDPLKADTDGDGLPDGEEVTEYRRLKRDRTGRGLARLATPEELRQYRSDPLKADTDGDGLSDYDELKTHKTDPSTADTDGDGLSDGDEVMKHRSNPLNPDTDEGGIRDGVEVQRGTDPLNRRDDVTRETLTLERGKTLILRGVNFESARATLTQDSENILVLAFNALASQPDLRVLIVGHTDAVGTTEYNNDLSLRRAAAVRNWLANRGIAPDRMTVEGRGEDEPIDSNDTPAGRAGNRRIEFRVLE